MSPTLLTILTFVAAVLAVAGIYSIVMDLFLRDRDRVNQRLGEEFQGRAAASVRKLQLFKNLEKFGPDPLTSKQAKESIGSRVGTLIEQSGLNLTAGRLLALSAACGLAVGGLTGGFSRIWWLGTAAGAAAAALPLLYVRFKRNQRLDRILSQLPDAFELIARLIRAGQTVQQAFQGVADEFQPPLAAEFAYCYEQQNLGLSPEVALRDMARRVDLVEVKIFVLAVLVQRQTGGNLAELIDNLAGIVRERFRIKGKIKVLTAEGRMEASVLLALPPVVFLMIFFLNRNYGSVLLEHPNLIYSMLGLMAVGIVWIRRIINFDF